jgi:hypothetical protein
MNIILDDLCKELKIDLGKGFEFSQDKFYKNFLGNVIKPLWNDLGTHSFVIGLLVNDVSIKYPFTTEEFSKLLK